ncbi:putative oligomerization/nucleic acid binding protein [Promicromonospora sp. AC04]|uniref:SHOCT domain-containing protein n=1 Tax=Promicromonospora sp. AC04 TaxID=2135723 RepID=UPI000D3563AF|nr:SHOCT domain-containing protein [Promicromonospora sp. AC04]PUB24501.1 putative oligomerization/nucleic acid binding protein [Promicromonospora sp. AC04]
MPGLLRGVARTAVVAGTATAVSNRVSRRQAGRWAAQAPPPEAYPPAPAPAPAAPPPASDMDARIAQLTQLAALRDQGVLSADEFEKQKAQILAG